MTNELLPGEKHMMRLMLRDKQPDGWTKLTTAGETVVLWT